jgi:uncharacterized integral membrane protein
MCATAIALALIRWRYGWYVMLGDELAPDRMPLSVGRLLLRLLLWTTATVGFVGLIRWIVPDWNAAVRDLKMGWPGVMLIALLNSAVSLPLIVAIVPLVLGTDRRRQFAVWPWAAIVCVIILIIVLTATVTGALDLFLVATGCFPFVAGFLVAACGSLLAVRLCGFRFVRRTRQPGGRQEGGDDAPARE